MFGEDSRYGREDGGWGSRDEEVIPAMGYSLHAVEGGRTQQPIRLEVAEWKSLESGDKIVYGEAGRAHVGRDIEEEKGVAVRARTSGGAELMKAVELTKVVES